MPISSVRPSLEVSSRDLTQINKTMRALLDATVQIKGQIDGFTKGIKIGDFDETVVLVQLVP